MGLQSWCFSCDKVIMQLYADALSHAQRAGISQQSGSVNLQPGLGILPTLFGMQQAPGESLPVYAASARGSAHAPSHRDTYCVA